jgi:hypothetical protein
VWSRFYLRRLTEVMPSERRPLRRQFGVHGGDLPILPQAHDLSCPSGRVGSCMPARSLFDVVPWPTLRRWPAPFYGTADALDPKVICTWCWNSVSNSVDRAATRFEMGQRCSPLQEDGEGGRLDG